MQMTEALGWESDGWTLEIAQEVLSRLQAAKRTGRGPVTLREEADANRQAERGRREEIELLERNQKTVNDLWDRYSKEVVAIENRPRTASEKIRIWQGRVGPAIGNLKINEVTEEEAAALVRKTLRLDRAGRVIGGKAEAANVYRLLHHMFQKALQWKLRAKELGNPLENLAEPKVKRRERLLTGSEIGALLKTLDEAEVDRAEYRQVIAVIHAAVLTGARISELLTLRWEDIHREAMELRLPDTKTGFSLRSISAAALSVFDSQERMPGVAYIFRGIKNPTNPLSYFLVEKAFRRLAAKAGVQNCSLHTIRHWFATMTANSVSNQRVGMALTGHKSHAAYMNYVHGDKVQARALAEQLAALADGLATAGSNIAELRKGGSRETTTLEPAKAAR
jgi:integrase